MLKKIKSHFIINESEEIILSKINNEPLKPINVYIHGYGAFYLKTSEEDFKQRINQVDGFEHVFVRWPSEHYSKAIIEGLTKGLSINQLRNFKSTTSTLANISTPLLIIGIEALTQIKKVQNKTHVLDTKFVERLIEFMLAQNATQRPINFVAHSFGTRLLLSALMKDENLVYLKQLNINHIVLMGGAIDINDVDWLKVLSAIKGNIHNCFSKKDWALAVKPDLDKNIGRYPIDILPEYQQRVINHEMNDLDHKSYWRKLDEVLKRISLI